MSSSEDDTSEPRRKWGKIYKEQYVREMDKQGRQCWKEFVTSKGYLVETRVTEPGCNCCKKIYRECHRRKKRCIINAVYSGRLKNEPVTYFMAVIGRHDIARHRPMSAESNRNSSSFKYFAVKGNTRVEVCRKAYMSLWSRLIWSKSLFCYFDQGYETFE